ncbi:MAG: DUF5610 domain-containing protein [Candidatus Riflebacteria bacterium]|nr:DUF5610 domain-containing protein [Candidatus Riflebacteria bacterium]
MVDKVQMPLSFSQTESGTVKTLSSLNSLISSTSNGVTDPLKGLNIDQMNLSVDAQNKIAWARSQFEVNYQVIKSINTSQGVETSQESFSFQASYDFLQKVSGQTPVPVPGSVAQSSSTDGQQASQNTQDAQAAQGTQTSQDALSQLQDYFSPEKTAQRILDVATSFYPVSDTGQAAGNTEAGRQKFSDFIGASIEEGFRQAYGLLGTLPDDVKAGTDKTHSLVFAGLDNFVKNGVDPEKMTTGGVMDKIAAYRLEAAQNTDRIRKSLGITGYNAQGDPRNTSSDTSTISTTG